MEEVDCNIHFLLKIFFRKFNECENCTTLATQMRNGNKNVTVANAVKTAVENYVANQIIK